MKNTFKILTILAFLSLVSGCENDPDLNMPDLKNGIIPVVEKDESGDLVIFDNNLTGFAGKVSVDLYYPEDAFESMSLMVSLNDDPSNSAVAINNIATFPANFSFTVTDLVALLPLTDDLSDLASGDFFRFYCNITLEDGTVVDGNNPLYTPYSSGIANLPGSSTNVVYPIACGYEPALATGSYYAYSAPDQWNSKGDVTITLDPEDNTTVYVTGLASIDGLDEDQGPLVMHIDPLTFNVTADRTVITSDFWGYTNGAYEGEGTFNSCTGEYTMYFLISDDGGPWGTFKYTLTRN